jgi:hypothetical protein
MSSPHHVDGLRSRTRLLAHRGHGKGVSITKFQNVDHHKIYDTYITFDMYNLGTPRRRMHFKKLATTPLLPFFYGRSVTTDHICSATSSRITANHWETRSIMIEPSDDGFSSRRKGLLACIGPGRFCLLAPPDFV